MFGSWNGAAGYRSTLGDVYLQSGCDRLSVALVVHLRSSNVVAVLALRASFICLRRPSCGSAAPDRGCSGGEYGIFGTRAGRPADGYCRGTVRSVPGQRRWTARSVGSGGWVNAGAQSGVVGGMARRQRGFDSITKLDLCLVFV